MSVLDTFAPRSGTPHVQDPTHHAGVVLDSASSSTDAVRVTLVKASNGIETFGPCAWQPRVREDGFVVFPGAGNACWIALGEDGTAIIVEWTPSGSSPTARLSIDGDITEIDGGGP